MKKTLKTLFIAIILFSSVNQLFSQKEENDNKIVSNLNKPERVEWLRDLGFGLFLNISLDSQLGMVIGHSMVGASDDYMNRYLNELPKTFDPYKYDAYRMAIQAKLAGAKYICITAKHHNGFCLWDTKTTDYKITNTPYKKDLLKEYVEGARKAGLAVGIYYSPEDFKFLYDNKIDVKRGGVKFTPEQRAALADLIRKQTKELFTQYGDIDMFFIDGSPKKECLEEAWKHQPNVVITRGAVNTPEQTLPGVGKDELWESCITMGTQWQYKPTNDELKSGTRLIEILVETRAKGGNLLLNVGPKPDGTIADPEERRLSELTTWNFINHEAVENVRPWVICNESNLWFTASKDRKTVYVVITKIPDWERGDRKEFVIGSIKATPQTKISVLGQNDKVVEYRNDIDAKSRFTQKEDGLHISVVRAQRIYNNGKWPNPITVKLENVEAAFIPSAFETMGASVAGETVTLKGKVSNMGDSKELKVCFEWRPYGGFVDNLKVTEWKRTEQIITQSTVGDFSQNLLKAEKGNTYEFRAVVIHPCGVTLTGEKKRFSIK
jgi:alpha-L-fucosidase